jgi:hypothetical protein
MAILKIGLTLNSTIEKSKAFFIKVFGLKIIDLAACLMSFDNFSKASSARSNCLSNCENKSSEF